MTETEKKLIARDWDEVVIHAPGVQPTLINSKEQFIIDNETLIIKYSQGKLPSSRGTDNYLDAHAEVHINLMAAIRIEFFKAKSIATPKSMIIAP